MGSPGTIPTMGRSSLKLPPCCTFIRLSSVWLPSLPPYPDPSCHTGCMHLGCRGQTFGSSMRHVTAKPWNAAQGVQTGTHTSVEEDSLPGEAVRMRLRSVNSLAKQTQKPHVSGWDADL